MASKVLSFAVNVLISFFLTSYIVSTVGAEAYGFVGLANEFISYVTVFTIAINSMAARFVTIELEKHNTENADEYMSSLLLADIAASLIVSLLGTMFILSFHYLININEALLPDVRLLWFFLLASFLIDLVGVVFSIAPFAKNRLDLEALRSTEAIVLKAAVLLVAYWLFPSAVWYIGVGALVQSIYTFLFNLRYTKKLLPNVKIKASSFSLNKLKTLFKAGLWNSITRLGTIMRSGLDLLLTNLFIGAGPMGILAIAKMIPQQLYSLFATMASAFMPKLVISFAHENTDEMKAQLRSAMRLLGLLSSVPVIIIICFGADFYSLWVPNQNASLLELLTVVICVPYIILLPLEPLWNVFTAMNKLRVTSIYLVIEAAVSLALTLLALQFVDGIEGKLLVIVGISSLMELIRSLLFLPIYSGYCLGGQYSFIYRLILMNVGVCVFGCAVVFMIKHWFIFASWMSLIFGVVLTAAGIIFLEYWIVLSRGERAFLVDRIKGMFKRS